MTYDLVIAVDWSARAKPGPKAPTKDSIFICAGRPGEITHPVYCRTRMDAMAHIHTLLDAALAAKERVFLGFDFAFGYPDGFAETLTGQRGALAVWDWLAARVSDAPDNANNRFEVAAEMNRACSGVGPFWGCPAQVELPDLPAKGTARHGHGMAERRRVEANIRSAQPAWKLFTTGSVGSQSLLGLPRLAALRARYGDDLSVWPLQSGWQAPEAAITVAEIYPSMLAPSDPGALDLEYPGAGYDILDAAQVRWVVEAILTAQANGTLEGWFHGEGDPAEEGWIFGANAARAPVAPPLKNDCFALPPGVHWTPVDEALDHLRDGLSRVVAAEVVELEHSLGRVLAQDIVALRDNPPTANAAVDGYGFAHASGALRMPLLDGRTAAGVPYDGIVPPGHAVRVLTGAPVPAGVDTIVMQEDVALDAGALHLSALPKPGANTRRAGEDQKAGAPIFDAGHVVRAPDLATLSALGHGSVPVWRRLRVGVLSTGDELAAPGAAVAPAQIYDANGPMLRGLIAGWGMEAVHLGRAPDDRDALRALLNDAASRCDAILTSGGASGGDEDHMSALLTAEGQHTLWRIAVKPGRPLALGLWQGVPLFGLPGNPVAAFVTAAIFARPALAVLAGAGWRTPRPTWLPAQFAKGKKAGRREFLRAKITPQGVEAYSSEGSGRVSGLSWADALIDLPSDALEIQRGDMVRVLPYDALLRL
ncbi:hypothetical protein PM03_00635 [Thalassobacter stenotrophicus]|uniref:molybdopterin-binding protein n=1 Tax=Thalassobacter TaxID=266808 RepID=UPI00051D37B8|nr:MULTISPECIES: molybdopterin-binding protein [Thalassobacter]KGK80475.1 hypothetical protein PM03_00635 [Thalassobacter stenotrophicus]KGL01858.1 molybdopterin biosynthesis protein MoeA [Thalassobacter sp. 16PALIMAR09]